MGTLVKGQSSLYLVEQVDETTYKAPTTGAEAIQPEGDSVEFTLTRETIDRNVWTDTIEKVEGRTGKETVEGTVAIEYKAAATAGAEPRGAVLYKSLFGGAHSVATTTTTLTGNTTTKLYVDEADLAKYKVGQCILVKDAGKFAVRPIKALVDNVTDFYIELAIALESAPADAVVIEKVTTYFHDKASPAFSAEHYIGGGIKEEVSGLKAVSASLEEWSAESVPKINFTLAGINVDRSVGAPGAGIKPDFSNDTLPPVLRGACAWIGSTHTSYSEITLSIENTSAELPDACSKSGKMGSRKTGFNVTASINPYMSDADVTKWDNFKLETKTSLFFYAYNPTAVEGEFKEVIAVYLPAVKITNMPTADVDGVLLDNIEFQAFRTLGNDTIFMSFI